MDYVPYAVPFFLLAILVELCYGWLKNKNTYRTIELFQLRSGIYQNLSQIVDFLQISLPTAGLAFSYIWMLPARILHRLGNIQLLVLYSMHNPR